MKIMPIVWLNTFFIISTTKKSTEFLYWRVYLSACVENTDTISIRRKRKKKQTLVQTKIKDYKEEEEEKNW